LPDQCSLCTALLYTDQWPGPSKMRVHQVPACRILLYYVQPCAQACTSQKDGQHASQAGELMWPLPSHRRRHGCGEQQCYASHSAVLVFFHDWFVSTCSHACLCYAYCLASCAWSAHWVGLVLPNSCMASTSYRVQQHGFAFQTDAPPLQARSDVPHHTQYRLRSLGMCSGSSATARLGCSLVG
jgi:hypothetical protein